MWLKFNGRSVHASVPHKGINPNYALAQFLTRLEETKHELKGHPLLGATTIAPTIIQVDTTSPNVTPAWTRVLLDIRTSAESSNSLVAYVNRLAGDFPHAISDAWAKLEGTPFPDSDQLITGFYTEPESEPVQKAVALIEKGMGRKPEFMSYQFATDGRFFTRFPIIGYSPAEEPLAHTVKESISIDKMAESLRGYVALLQKF